MDLHLNFSSSIVADIGLCPWKKEQLLTLLNPLKAEPYANVDLCPHCNSFVALHMSMSVTSLINQSPPNFIGEIGANRLVAAAPSPKKQGECLHAKRKDRCKLCGGIGVCVHGRMKAECVSCKVREAT
jgi:hypothetical protein